MKVLLIILILIMIIIIIYRFNYRDMTYVKSDIDNDYYLVRDVYDKQLASNTLATIKMHILGLTNHMYTNRNTKPFIEFKQYIEQLNDRIKNTVIIESSQDSVYTSYSVNKGEQLVFCLRSRRGNNGLHDLNLMMYVVLHEMSHVACTEIGHTTLFKKIFNFITNIAIERGLYTKIPFRETPKEYCGMQITDSIV